MGKELQVISDFYDLQKYVVERIGTFPRHHRAGMGVEMVRQMKAIMTLLIRCKYLGRGEEKVGLLTTANVEVEALRFQLRLACDLSALARNSHGHAIGLLGQVGAQIGGWLKSVRGPGEPPK